MKQITAPDATVAEALVKSMAGIMVTFPAYTTADFYGYDGRKPMEASHFFGVVGMVNMYAKMVEKQTKVNRHGKY